MSRRPPGIESTSPVLKTGLHRIPEKNEAPIDDDTRYTTVIVDEKSKQAVIIDPVGDPHFLLAQLAGLRISQIFLTSCGAAIAGPAAKLWASFLPGPLAIHEDDLRLLTPEGLDELEEDSCEGFEGVLDRQLVPLDGRIFHVPSRTPGSYCVYFEWMGALFSGLNLDDESLSHVYPQLPPLDSTTRVIPAIGPETTIADIEDKARLTLPASASWRSLITSDRWDAQLKYQTNILGDSSRREAIVIDPRAPTQLILSVIREMGCSLKQILLTARYTECNRIAYELQKKVNGDAQILLHPEHEHSWNLFASRGEVITNLHDGQPLALFDGRAVFAPGPPSGTCCFYFPTLGLLCTGRRLVNAGVRRPEDGTDVAELEEWLLQFPPSTVIAPGFGQRTTVEFQMEITKKQLKRLQGEDDGEEEGEDPTYGGDEDEDEDLDDAQVQDQRAAAAAKRRRDSLEDSFSAMQWTHITATKPGEKRVKSSNAESSPASLIHTDIPSAMQIDLNDLEDLHQPLGQGGFGSVHRYRWISRNRIVAVKKPSNYDAAHQIESLKQECEILHRLRHSYVIELLGVCDHQGMRWPVLAIADQGSLSSYLARYPTVTFDWRIRLCLGCTMAVEYIHSHPSGPVLHHDIKPSNFLLNDEHHVQRIKIADFGIAKTRLLDATTSTVTKNGPCSLHYVAPEVGQLKYSKASDVYSLAILFFVVCTGRRPYAAEHPRDEVRAGMRPGIPQWLEEGCAPLCALIRECWSDLPHERPTCSEIQTRLVRILLQPHELESVKIIATHEILTERVRIVSAPVVPLAAASTDGSVFEESTATADQQANHDWEVAHLAPPGLITSAPVAPLDASPIDVSSASDPLATSAGASSQATSSSFVSADRQEYHDQMMSGLSQAAAATGNTTTSHSSGTSVQRDFQRRHPLFE